MKETKQDLVSIKVRPRDAEWAATEQLRLRKAIHKKVTQADFFALLRAQWSRKDAGLQLGVAAQMGQVVEGVLRETGDGAAISGEKGTGDAFGALIRAIEEGTRATQESNRRTASVVEALERIAARGSKRGGNRLA